MRSKHVKLVTNIILVVLFAVLVYAAVPTHDTPLLFSANNATNNTEQNITLYNVSTADVDGDPVKNIIDWRNSGQSIAVLNMPFEGGSSTTFTKDYSTNSNNGTVVQATWNSTGGYDGFGAYNFNGSQRIFIGKELYESYDSGTVTAWIKPNISAQAQQPIVSFSDEGANGPFLQFVIFRDVGNVTGIQAFKPSGVQNDLIHGNTSLVNGQWYHVAYVNNGTSWKLYVNGEEEGTTILVGNNAGSWFDNLTSSNTSLTIGSRIRQLDSYYFEGSISEVMIYDRELSIEQIQALYQNRTELIVSQELSVGQNWTAAVTPNDGTSDGETKTSNALIITDLPTADLSINQTLLIYPQSPQQYDTVEFSSIIYNQVSADQSNINITLFIDSEAVNSTLIASLPGFNSTTINFTWNATPSNRSILVAVDPANAITENNEGNNNVTTSLIVNKVIRLNHTSPENLVEIPRGGTGTIYEDSESYVSDATTIRAVPYNIYNLSEAIDATCTFMLNTTQLGTNQTNSTGSCEYQFNHSSLQTGLHTVFVNFSNLTTGFISDTTTINSTKTINITVYETDNMELNTRGAGLYLNGDAAVLQVNITKDDVLYDPANITIYVRRSSPNNIIAIKTYPDTMTKDGTGQYTAVHVINDSFGGTAIHWDVHVEDNQTINGVQQAALIPVTSGSHSDININSATSTLNLYATNDSNELLQDTNITLYDRSGYILESENITTLLTRPGAQNDTYDADYITPTGTLINLRTFNISDTSNFTLAPQVVQNYTAELPNNVENISTIIAINDSTFTFTNATLHIPLNGMNNITNIYHCTNWNFTNASCATWESSSTSSYADFNENATHFSFTVTTFSAYAGGQGGDTANLTIDNNGPQLTDTTVSFNATYYNITSHALISGANCNITFNDTNTNVTMSEYADKYEYNRSFNTSGAYSYTVTCIATGHTALSATDNVTITALTPPGITSIENNNSSPALNDVFFLNWTLSDDSALSSTWLQITNSSGTSNTTPQTLSGTSGVGNYTYTTTDPKTTNISFIAYVNDTQGTQNASASLSVIVQNTVPGTPSLHLPENNTNFSDYATITLNWSNVTDIDGDSITYILEVSNVTDFSYIEYGNTSITESIHITGLTTPTLQNGTHYWRVRANDGTGNSSYSTIRTFNTTTIPHTITINSPALHQPSQKLQTTLNITVSKTGSIWYNLNNQGNITLCTGCTEGTRTLNFTSFGNHTILLFTNDTSNNLINDSRTFTLQQDTDGNGTADSNEGTDDDDGDGIANVNDTLKGNLTNLNTNTATAITINGSSNLSQQFTGVLTVNITNTSTPILTFDYNFSANQTLNLANITLNKQNSSSTQGTTYIYGLNITTGQTKTLYIEDIDTSKTGICIKDSEVNSIDNITSNCSGADETKITCSSSGGTNGTYTCTDQGAWYKLTGANNTLATETSITTSSTGSGEGGGGGRTRTAITGLAIEAPTTIRLNEPFTLTITNTGYTDFSHLTLNLSTTALQHNIPPLIETLPRGTSQEYTITFTSQELTQPTTVTLTVLNSHLIKTHFFTVLPDTEPEKEPSQPAPEQPEQPTTIPQPEPLQEELPLFVFIFIGTLILISIILILIVSLRKKH